MGKNGVVAVIYIFIFFSTTCNASLVFHLRELVATDPNNGSTTSEIPPAESPVNELNAINIEKPQPDKPRESVMGNQTKSSMTLPGDSNDTSKQGNDAKTVSAPGLPVVEENDGTVGEGNGKVDATSANLGNTDSCEGSVVNCRDKEMVACIQATKGSNSLFLVVKNEGEITFKVNVQIPNDLPAFEVPKHESRRIDISSTKGKTTELIVNSGNAKCVLPLVKSVSVDNLIHLLSFYSKQVTPIYAAYASFLVALLLGASWVCCRLRKRNQDGIPYQELEMGLPEPSSCANMDEEEGWDNDWGDNWDKDSIVKSLSEQVRSASADGLVSWPSARDGWDDDWED